MVEIFQAIAVGVGAGLFVAIAGIASIAALLVCYAVIMEVFSGEATKGRAK